MHSDELISWLKKYRLLSIAKNHSVHYRNVLQKSLKVSKKEKILIISDYGLPRRRVAPLISGAYTLAARNLGLNVELIMQGIKSAGDMADKKVVQALKEKKDPGIVILSLSNKLGKLGPKLGKSYRRYVKEKKHRFVSTTGMDSLVTSDFYSLTRALNVNYLKLRKECDKLKKALDWGREIEIKTSTGTYLWASIRGQKSVSNDGKYGEKSHGGNMPAGEVYIAPKINTAEGKVVINVSTRSLEKTTKIRKPITLTIKKGMVTRIDGLSEAKLLKKSLLWAERRAKRPSMVRQIGEIGIGMNPRATPIGAMIVDEKALGTSHVAIGSNYWFGGDVFTIIHLDQVFKNPHIFIDGKEFKLPKKKYLL